MRKVAVVKWFDNDKGFGFLVDSQGSDVFIHYRHIDPGEDGYKTLREGEQVEYQPVRTDKGWSAAEVRRSSELVSVQSK